MEKRRKRLAGLFVLLFGFTMFPSWARADIDTSNVVPEETLLRPTSITPPKETTAVPTPSPSSGVSASLDAQIASLDGLISHAEGIIKNYETDTTTNKESLIAGARAQIESYKVQRAILLARKQQFQNEESP